MEHKPKTEIKEPAARFSERTLTRKPYELRAFRLR
jgi:hypothetical protein